MEIKRCLEEIKELLPWYVNGTLTKREQKDVARHLSRCRDCHKEVEELQELKSKVIALAESLPSPSLDLFARTLNRIESRAREAEQFKEELKRRLIKEAFKKKSTERKKHEAKLNLGFFTLGFTLGVMYERGRLPFNIELSTLDMPISRLKGKI